MSLIISIVFYFNFLFFRIILYGPSEQILIDLDIDKSLRVLATYGNHCSYSSRKEWPTTMRYTVRRYVCILIAI